MDYKKYVELYYKANPGIDEGSATKDYSRTRSSEILKIFVSRTLLVHVHGGDTLTNLPMKIAVKNGLGINPLLEGIKLNKLAISTPLRVERVILSLFTSTNFSNIKDIKRIPRGRYTIDFSKLNIEILQAAFQYILNHKNPRISKSWLAPIQERLIKNLEPTKRKIKKKEVEEDHYDDAPTIQVPNWRDSVPRYQRFKTSSAYEEETLPASSGYSSWTEMAEANEKKMSTVEKGSKLDTYHRDMVNKKFKNLQVVKGEEYARTKLPRLIDEALKHQERMDRPKPKPRPIPTNLEYAYTDGTTSKTLGKASSYDAYLKDNLTKLDLSDEYRKILLMGAAGQTITSNPVESIPVPPTPEKEQTLESNKRMFISFDEEGNSGTVELDF